MTVLHTIIIELLDFQSGMLIGHAEDLYAVFSGNSQILWFHGDVAIRCFHFGYGIVSDRNAFQEQRG